MIEFSSLTPKSVLGHLPLINFQVHVMTLGLYVAQQFEHTPDLPGVIVTNNAKVAGLISRQRFIERMSRPYGPEIHLRRPIHLLLPFIEVHPLLLRHTCPIHAAVRKALLRPSDYAYDPIIVVLPDCSFRLLDTRLLILAQSQILATANAAIRQNEEALQRSLTQLQQEQAKIQEKNQLLEAHQSAIEERNQRLEEQQAELLQKSHEIGDLNQRFVQISQILSIEGEKAFKATFGGVDAISGNADRMIEIGQALADQMETVRIASGLIRKVSHDARHLATLAAILVNQFGREFDGVSRIASDISKLSQQAFDAGERMDTTASRLKARIGDMTKLARQGAIEARALLGKVARAKVALLELEKLVLQQDDELDAAPADGSPRVAQTLMQQVNQMEVAISELEKIATRSYSTYLIRKIAKRLKQAQPDETPVLDGDRPIQDASSTTWQEADTFLLDVPLSQRLQH
jgi:hypothetical protein